MTAITIRHVEAADAEAVRTIFQSSHVARGTTRLPSQAPEKLARWVAYDPAMFKLVAEIEGRVAGYAELQTYPDWARHRQAGEINMITTHPDFRGRGVGDALMTALLDTADNWLALHRMGLFCWADNPKAVRLYERYDFVREGVMREFVVLDGGFCDAAVTGRIRHVPGIGTAEDA
jgi:L-phenylalanine/L-methionine N-acetyltransferase